MQSPNSRKALGRLQRREKVYHLRKLGYSQPEIARELGIDQPTVSRDLALCYDAYRKQQEEEKPEIARIELSRLDALQKVFMAKALEGDQQSGALTLRISERRAKLLGIDAPQKLQVDADLTTEALKAKLLAALN